MKKTVINIAALFLVSVITGMVVVADTMTEHVTFANPVIVNGTVIKDGVYKLEFNDQTGTLSFKKDGHMVAGAPARLERVDKHAPGKYTTRTEGESRILLSVSMDDGYKAVLEN